MSDEQNQPATTSVAGTTGYRWGDPISEGRQAQLEAKLKEWETAADHGERAGPFDGGPFRIRLTGADVFYLAACALAGSFGGIAPAQQALRKAGRQV
jgi:hypothetical protein